MDAMPFEISPAEAKQKWDAGEAALIDVREVGEHQIASIDGAELIPMGTVPQRLSHLEELADEKLLVVFCHHGVRSLNVVNWVAGPGRGRMRVDGRRDRPVVQRRRRGRAALLAAL